MVNKQQMTIGAIALAGIILISTIAGGIFTTQEGYVDAVYRNGKVVRIADPGLNFKIPFIEETREVETRVRKNEEVFPVVTSGINKETGQAEVQTPSRIKIAAIWSAPKENIIEILQTYGSLEQFEERILDNKLLNASKEEASKRSIEGIVTDRNDLKMAILQRFKELMKDFKVITHDVEVVDFEPNDKYMTAVNNKLIAKQKAEEEAYTLQQNALIEERKENAANSYAKALNTKTAADAQRVKDLGDAEAHKIKQIQQELAKSPLYIQFTIADKWNGVQPQTLVTGQEKGMLLNFSTNSK